MQSGHVSNAEEMAMSSLAQLTGKTSDLLPLMRSNIINKLKPEQNGRIFADDVVFKQKMYFVASGPNDNKSAMF